MVVDALGVVDTSRIDLDWNKQKNGKSNEDLKDKDYKWWFDGNEFFIRFKLALQWTTRQKDSLFLILIYLILNLQTLAIFTNTSHCQIFKDMLENLKRRVFLKQEQ